MFNLKELREQRTSLVEQQEALFTVAKQEGRNLTTDENQRFDAIEADVAEIRGQIERAKQLEANLAAKADAAGERLEDKPREYREIFNEFMVNGSENLTRDERRIMAQHRGTNPQQSGNDGLGGYTVPEGFSNELFTEMAYWGGMFEAARIVTTASGNLIPWPTVDDTSNSGGILAETATDVVSDVTFNEKELSAYTYTSNIIKASEEFLQDSFFDLASWLNPLAARRIGVAANAHFTTGTGSSQPNGVATAAGAGVTAASATAITRGELVDLIHSVDRGYRNGAIFMFNDSTLAAIKKLSFGSSDDRPLWQAGNITQGEPGTLEGYRYIVNNDMDSIATGNDSVLFGDFSKYIIRQAGQPTMKRLNERYADALHVGFIMFQRLDGELLSSNAIKKLTQA